MASLIKIGGGKTPPRAIQFTDGDGGRKTIRLGRCGLEAAREFKRQIEILVSHAITNAPMGAATSEWLAGLPDRIHEKLAGKGLVAPRNLRPVAPTQRLGVTTSFVTLGAPRLAGGAPLRIHSVRMR